MSVKIVLQNTVAQLETQKTKAYADAQAVMLAQLNPTFETFKQEQKAKYDEAAATLKESYDKLLAEKQDEINTQAKAYAEAKVASIDGSIAEIQKLIETAED